MAVPALPLAAGGELPPDLEEQRLHKLQLQRLAEEMLKRRQSASTEEKLRAQVKLYMRFGTPRLSVRQLTARSRTSRSPASTPPLSPKTLPTASTLRRSPSEAAPSKGVARMKRYLCVEERGEDAGVHVDASALRDGVSLPALADGNAQRLDAYVARLHKLSAPRMRDLYGASVRQAREADQPEEDVRVQSYTSLFASQLAEAGEPRTRASSVKARRAAPPPPSAPPAGELLLGLELSATELCEGPLACPDEDAPLAEAGDAPQSGGSAAADVGLSGTIAATESAGREGSRARIGLAELSPRSVCGGGDAVAAGDERATTLPEPSFNGGGAPSEGSSAAAQPHPGTAQTTVSRARFEGDGHQGSDVVDLSPRSATPASALASSSGRQSTPRERRTLRGVSFMPPLDLQAAPSDARSPTAASTAAERCGDASSAESLQGAFAEPLTPGRDVPLAQRAVPDASPRGDDGPGGCSPRPQSSSAAGSTPRSEEVAMAFTDTIRRRSSTWARAGDKVGTPELAQQGSFTALGGHRRLGRRDSDVMWLNMALDESEGVHAALRKPRVWAAEAWARLSDAARLAVLQADTATITPAAADPRARAARARALLATVVEHNGPAFSEVDADREASEYRRLADRARGHLAAVNSEPDGRHAVYARGYRDALGELARMRPAYQPCLHAVPLERAAARSGAAVQRKAVAWTLTTSAYFQRRKKEAESRDFGDMEAIYLQQFDTDWARVAGKERFVAMVGRSDKELLATDRVELQRELDEVKAGLQRHTVAVAMMFIFYSNVVLGRWRSDSMLKIDLERFRLLVADLRVVDARGRTCRSVNELDAVFVATNYEEGVASAADDDANDDDALMRFELYEMLVRIAFSKFIASHEMADASDALDRLMAHHVMPYLPAEALVDPNAFRFQRLYTQEVEEVLVAHGALVDAVFKVYKAKDKTRWLWIEHWKLLLDTLRLLERHPYGLAPLEARLLFFWSQAVVRDELKCRQRSVSLAFSDFVELLCRVADRIDLPTRAQLAQFFGGRAHVPEAHPWGEYYFEVALKPHGAGGKYSRAAAPWLGNEPEFRKRLATDEIGVVASAQVYVPIGRPATPSPDLTGDASRPLAGKLEAFLDVVAYAMRDEWGGATREACAERMLTAARQLSGGVEL